jgi:glutathione S-transferase
MKLYEAAGDERRPFSNRPYSWRIVMALAHKGLSVERIALPISDKSRFAFSGQALLPVLVDDDAVVPDSWSIACYLEETYADAPPLFGDPVARAQARFIHAWGDQWQAGELVPMLVHDAWQHSHPEDRDYFRTTREARLGCTLEEAISQRGVALTRFRTKFQPLRTMLRAQLFICGRRPAYADYIAFSHLQWARSVNPYRLLNPDDPVFGWRERMLDLFDGLARKQPGYDV